MENREDELIFVFFKEPKSKGGLGNFEVVQVALNKIIDQKETYNLVLWIVTDGVGTYTGQKKSLDLCRKWKKSRCN